MEERPSSLSFVDPFTLLAVNSAGQLKYLHVPFRVQCVQPGAAIPMYSWVYVDGVWQDKEHRLLFKVSGATYPYWYFRLTVLF